MLWLLILLLFLAGTLQLRWRQAETLRAAEAASAEDPAPAETMAAETAEEAEQASPAIPEATPMLPEEAPAEVPMPDPEPAPPAGEMFYTPAGYSEYTYGLVSDLLYAYRNQEADRAQVISARLEELKNADPPLGKAWEGILDYWTYADTDMQVNVGAVPDGLPEDDSLCIVVLGFQLGPYGEMLSELQGRCQIALEAAQKYPNAWIAVTGGGTAKENKAVTEASVMAAWLMENGVSGERIITEDLSMTTGQNAQYTTAILAERYPQVKNLVMVTSDYHVPLGCLLFTETALLYEYEHGELPFSVISNAGFPATDYEGYQSVKLQSQYVWIVADPTY